MDDPRGRLFRNADLVARADKLYTLRLIVEVQAVEQILSPWKIVLRHEDAPVEARDLLVLFRNIA